MNPGDSSDPGPSLVGWAIRQIAIWGGLTLLLYVAIGSRSLWLPSLPGLPEAHPTGHPTAPAQHAAAMQPQGDLSQQAAVPTDALVYHANPQGHVLLDAVVNGVPIHFIVDTGATLVTLSMKDAAAVGLAPYQLNFTGRANTANGVTRVAPVRLREIRIGQLAIEDVAAVVNENLAMSSLLGQSFLNRLQSYEMRNGVLTITW